VRVDYASLIVQQQRGGSIPEGVLISEVLLNSAADRAGLKAGDVVQQVGQNHVRTPAAFYKAIGAGVGPVELTVQSAQLDAPMKVTLK
jgi:S1-C subfamily serine protease